MKTRSIKAFLFTTGLTLYAQLSQASLTEEDSDKELCQTLQSIYICETQSISALDIYRNAKKVKIDIFSLPNEMLLTIISFTICDITRIDSNKNNRVNNYNTGQNLTKISQTCRLFASLTKRQRTESCSKQINQILPLVDDPMFSRMAKVIELSKKKLKRAQDSLLELKKPYDF